MTTLFIGNKNYSSWSMRPWLALTWGGFAFEERVLSLGMTGYGKSRQPAILAASPSGRVPALDLGGGVVIWDSMAICEWAAEQAPALYPQAPEARALCRAAAAEMHAGFTALRKEAPMNVRRRTEQRAWSADMRQDLARLEEMWSDLRARFGAGGPYLFGRRSIADAFYTPVATRFRTYGVTLSPPAQAYCEALLADRAFLAWEEAALAEPWAQPDIDGI
ncbi:MAG: glutathione S-transferase N-terminal domain-containing protein [Hyphomonadaceae bacterium]